MSDSYIHDGGRRDFPSTPDERYPEDAWSYIEQDAERESFDEHYGDEIEGRGEVHSPSLEETSALGNNHALHRGYWPHCTECQAADHDSLIGVCLLGCVLDVGHSSDCRDEEGFLLETIEEMQDESTLDLTGYRRPGTWPKDGDDTPDKAEPCIVRSTVGQLRFDGVA